MSVIYDGLKEAQEVRQSKFSRALRKSSLENDTVQPVRSRTWKFKWGLAFIILSVLFGSFAVFGAIKYFSPEVKKVNPVAPIQLIKPQIKIKPKAITAPPTHKTIHHKKKKKHPLSSPSDT